MRLHRSVLLREAPTTIMRAPDPVPLGISGKVTIPQRELLPHIAKGAPKYLATEALRLQYVTACLQDGMLAPVSVTGSAAIAAEAMEYFAGTEIVPALAEKALETMRTGVKHKRAAASPGEPRMAVAFTAWPGTRDEVQPQRKGLVVGQLLHTARVMIEQGVQIAGILEIAAYVWDRPDRKRPQLPLDEISGVQVEFGYLPGFLCGSTAKVQGRLSKVLMFNEHLLSAEEMQWCMEHGGMG